MKLIFRILSCLISCAIVISSTNFEVANRVLHAIGIVSSTITIALTLYAIMTTIKEIIEERVKENKTKK